MSKSYFLQNHNSLVQKMILYVSTLALLNGFGNLVYSMDQQESLCSSTCPEINLENIDAQLTENQILNLENGPWIVLNPFHGKIHKKVTINCVKSINILP